MNWVDRLAGLVPLLGSVVRLEALTQAHHAALCEVGFDPDLWALTVSLVRTPADMAAYIDAALQGRSAGTAFGFAIVEQASGRVAGSTRFGNMDPVNRRLEIGWTWVARAWQRSAVNTEAKLLLLAAAFEQLGCIRVEFKTDVLNERSRNALRGIGAKEEGVLRSHMITASGRVRDTVYYSILADEWPTVRAHLEARLARPARAAST
ncbi:MAG TPA: GNAT family protein [Longimicrobiales bacterium]|nr:GNAT family protein [Longimicrobiales bacterium]